MTARDIGQLVASADPQARHYVSYDDGRNFTVWAEYKRLGVPGDDEHGDGWKFQIDRYTKVEYDPVAEMIETVLRETEGVAYTYMVDYERDTGYIRHIFDCQGC